MIRKTETIKRSKKFLAPSANNMHMKVKLALTRMSLKMHRHALKFIELGQPFNVNGTSPGMHGDTGYN